jgi:Ca2+:H+ antiporter
MESYEAGPYPHSKAQENIDQPHGTMSSNVENEIYGDNSGTDVLPRHYENEKSRAPGILGGLVKVKSAGESGRQGFHPGHFVRVCARSTCTMSMIVNILWPFVPAAIAVRFARPDLHVWVFVLNYIAIVPTANLLGFAGGELARKLPKVWGIVIETTLSSVVELVLFMVLIKEDDNGNLIPVIQAAILGSILANLLLCLGMCFFAGGLRRDEQVFHESVSEVGSGLLLVAGFGLLIPSAFYSALSGQVTEDNGRFPLSKLLSSTREISRATAIILLVAFMMYVDTPGPFLYTLLTDLGSYGSTFAVTIAFSMKCSNGKRNRTRIMPKSVRERS